MTGAVLLALFLGSLLVGAALGGFFSRRRPRKTKFLLVLAGAACGVALFSLKFFSMSTQFEAEKAAEQKKFAAPEFDVILPERTEGRIYWLFFDNDHPAPPQKSGRGQLAVPASGSLAVGDVHLDTSKERHGSYRASSLDGKPLQIQTLDGDFTFEGRAVRYVKVFVGNYYEFGKANNAPGEPWVEAYSKAINRSKSQAAESVRAKPPRKDPTPSGSPSTRG